MKRPIPRHNTKAHLFTMSVFLDLVHRDEPNEAPYIVEYHSDGITMTLTLDTDSYLYLVNAIQTTPVKQCSLARTTETPSHTPF